MGRRSGSIRKLATGVLLALALVSSVDALSHDDVREPVVKFIDFYVASQQADVPPMSLWERVLYGLALANTPDRPSTPSPHCQ